MKTATRCTKPPVQRAPITLQGQSRRKRLFPGALAGLGFAAFFLVSVPALAAIAPSLGTAAPYAVLGTNNTPTSGTVTCSDTGPGTFINGDVGSTFTSITNNACSITGSVTAPVLPAVVTDFNNARVALNNLNPTCDGTIPISSTTLAPGVYCSAAGTTIGTGVILTLSGTASDVWVFRVGTTGPGALTLTGANVVMGGTAQACNVWWGTSGDATVTDASFVGTILSGGAATMTRGSFLGRLMATTDATLTDPAPMTFAGCEAAPTVQVTKISNGGVDTFNFTGNNGFASQAITTLATGVGVAGATQTLTAAGVSTMITESAPPAGYALASIVCSGLGTGGTATSNIGARIVTLDAAATAAGAAIKCTFTNNLPAAVTTVQVTKVSNGGVGTFSFTGTNGIANHDITTVTSGVGVAGATQTLTTAGVSTQVTESAPPPGYALASIACSGLGTGGAATPNIGTRTVTLDTAATAAGAAIKCTFINKLNTNTITVNKDFIPNSSAAVPVALKCSSGTVTTTPLNASESTPAVFTVTGASPGATCTALETVPAGYTGDQSNCVGVMLGGSCTITNTLSIVSATPIPLLNRYGLAILGLLILGLGFIGFRRFG